ncbi:hypothetical protein T281_17405 [Rhodomicrobium udaipurense JA643]|uniref:Uncharacterized protein n=1 Tax=Rhodomicrobium udaipurense TaxID=1202716 RepID=A0A8I1KJR9_9HYPH|nr:hypothetical protein [Rhodomicrobium udaipurense]KAI93319.1 hypothetical protein T281_17405 [Rhodomicrobium udaipurense JA643]MBJ7544122.1 hypothetical protein [Rhodomicrobium udaipurense]
MDLQDKRMQCLRMAAELGGNVDAVIAAAQRMFDFVRGTEPAAPACSPVTNGSPEPIAVAEPQAEVATAQAGAIAEAATSEPAVADPIAACGTVLVLPESGNLAEALPSPEAVTAAEVRVEVAAEDGPAEIKAEGPPAEITADETPAEAVAEVHAEAVAEEAPAEIATDETPAEAAAEVQVEAVAEVHAEAVAEEAPAEITTDETPAEAAAEVQVEAVAEVATEGTPEVVADKELLAEAAEVPATNPIFVLPAPPTSFTDVIGEQPAPHA